MESLVRDVGIAVDAVSDAGGGRFHGIALQPPPGNAARTSAAPMPSEVETSATAGTNDQEPVARDAEIDATVMGGNSCHKAGTRPEQARRTVPASGRVQDFPCSGLRPSHAGSNARRTASGSFWITRRSAAAGPLTRRVPCSHFR